MLEAADVACSRGDRDLFRNLGFTLQRGRLLRVTGPNGSGKTSLLRILCGLRAPSGGEVRWDGASIARAEAREAFHKQLLYIGHQNGLKDEFSAFENLAASARLAGVPDADRAARAALERLGLAGAARLPVRFLSQGQKRRAALARLVLFRERPLWILDEAFNALDGDAVRGVESLLLEHAAAGGMVVFTSHFELGLDAAGSQTLTRLDVGDFDARRVQGHNARDGGTHAPAAEPVAS